MTDQFCYTNKVVHIQREHECDLRSGGCSDDCTQEWDVEHTHGVLSFGYATSAGFCHILICRGEISVVRSVNTTKEATFVIGPLGYEPYEGPFATRSEAEELLMENVAYYRDRATR